MPLCSTISFGVNLSVVGFHIYEHVPNLLNSFRLLSFGVNGSPVMFQPFVSKEYSARYSSVAFLISKALLIEVVDVNISSTYFLMSSLKTSCSILVHFMFFSSCVVSCTNTFDSNSAVVVVPQLISQIFIELVACFSISFVRVLLGIDCSLCIMFVYFSWLSISYMFCSSLFTTNFADMLLGRCCSLLITFSGVLVETCWFELVIISVGLSLNAKSSNILVFQTTFLDSILYNSISENPCNADSFFGFIMFLLIILLTSNPTFLNIVTWRLWTGS